MRPLVAWGTGQDQTHSLARMLKLLMPSIRIWLDVDNLDDVGKLEASVNLSAAFIIFLSKGYFKSFNCRRELYTALQDGSQPKPIISVWEADENKGGATLAQLRQEAMEFCDESLPEYPGYGGVDVTVERVFDSKENIPIAWVGCLSVCGNALRFLTLLRILQAFTETGRLSPSRAQVRVHDFQIESLKAVALRIMRGMPHEASVLANGLVITGELGEFQFDEPITLLVSRANGTEAWSVAEELRRAAIQASTPAEHFQLKYADEDALLNDGHGPRGQTRLSNSAIRPRSKTALLLYMNQDLFCDGDMQTTGSVAHFVQKFLKLRVRYA